MKSTACYLGALVLAVTPLFSSIANAGHRVAPAPSSEPAVAVREEFGTFFGITPYSDTLGLALFRSGRLYESRRLTLEESNPEGNAAEIRDKAIDEAKKLAEANGGELITDYTKMGLGTTLEFENNSGSAVLLRVRRQFQFLNESSEDATFDYVDDRELGDSGSRLEAAVMLDWYIDPLYNGKWVKNPLWIQRQFRFWLRTGFEIQKNDLPGVQEVDHRKLFAFLNFQANPDQDADFLGIPSLPITSPQIVQLGAVLARNEITGEEDWNWVIGWAPRFQLLEAHGPFTGFGLNKRMYFLGDDNRNASATVKEAVRVNVDEDESEKVVVVERNPAKGWYASIDPGLTVMGESTARGVFEKVAESRSIDSLEKLQEEQLRWHLKVLVGVNDGLFELSYSATGCHPISDLGEGHIGQELRADLNLYKLTSPGPKDWRNLTAYVSYKRGQFEPNFEDVDILAAGVSLRF